MPYAVNYEVSDSHQQTNPLQPLSADHSQAWQVQKVCLKLPNKTTDQMYLLQKLRSGAGEMIAQMLLQRTRSLPSTHIVVHNHVLTPVSGDF